MRIIPILLFIMLLIAVIAGEKRGSALNRTTGPAIVEQVSQADERNTGEMIIVSVVRALVRRSESDV